VPEREEKSTAVLGTRKTEVDSTKHEEEKLVVIDYDDLE
jgi:hypothetical protein